MGEPEGVSEIYEDKNTAMSKNYTYETECRRCSGLHEWVFADKLTVTLDQFMQAITDYIQNPRIIRCTSCFRDAVQEVVSINKD